MRCVFDGLLRRSLWCLGLGMLLLTGASVALAQEAGEARADGDALVIELPSPFEQFCSGGAGRFLILHLPQANELAVVDVVEGKIAGKISVPDQDIRIAAGIDKLIVVLRGQKLLHRYSLDTLKREKTVPLQKIPQTALMGQSSAGPLLLWSEGEVELWDIERLKPLKMQGQVLKGPNMWDWQMRVSADGQTFSGWLGGISGQRFDVMRLSGTRSEWKQTPDAFAYNARWAQPNADGSLLVRFDAGLYTHDLQPIATDALRDAVLVPSVDPRFLLALWRKDDGRATTIEILTAADRQVVYRLEDIEPVTQHGVRTEWGYYKGQPRVHYLPENKVLVTLPEGNQQVRLREVDLLQYQRETGDDFLIILSKPPVQAVVGTTYEYQIEAHSKSGNITYALEAGPEGMKVSLQGQIEWPVRSRPTGGKATTIVAVTDASGKELFHTFDVEVIRQANLASRPGSPRRPMPRQPSGSMPEDDAMPDEARPESSRVVELDENRLEMLAGPVRLFPGLGGETLLALQGTHLAVLGSDGRTIVREVDFAKPYQFIGERESYYVALAAEPQSVDVIDKKTLKVERSLKLSYLGLTDLVLHPSRPVSYVAFKDAVEVPRFHFLIFNERTGEGQDSPDYIGTWLACDPSGKFLIAGYRDIYERGARLILNPDRFHIVPEYGGIDWLIRYDLRPNGVPANVEVREEVGGNGSGLRMAADGKRVTYLSHVGTPTFSGNLGGFDPRNLSKVPISYTLKDRGSTHELAYHPTLSIVATLGVGSVIFFDRETGTEQRGRIELTDDTLEGGKIERLYFSPDGKYLLLDINVNEIHYLHRVALNLTPAERSKLKSPARQTSLTPSSADASPVAKVPLKDFDALAGGQGKAMSTRDISRQFMDSVVVVSTDDSSGTGFIIGRKGYILTCAHCVPEDLQILVSLRETKAGKVTSRKLRAEVLHRDDERDLALLKVATVTPLPPVPFAPPVPVETGERVAVIGNPGVGDTILDYTITEGIISSAARELAGQTVIQTSAAVNPGSSGGPMFNERGEVVGLVALKARIEGAGFAVPVTTLTSFLLETASTAGDDAQLFRRWQDASGRFEIQANYLGLENGSVQLRREDGEQISVPVNRLSPADQQFLKLLGPTPQRPRTGTSLLAPQ